MDPTPATDTIDFDESLASDFDVLAAGTVLAERYEVRDFLGRGGYAAVYLKIIHRDLKPENILIDEDGTAKIADFRLAYFVDRDQSRVTSTGAVAGTTAYLSPEAREALDRERGRNIIARAHAGIVPERFERIAGGKG